MVKLLFDILFREQSSLRFCIRLSSILDLLVSSLTCVDCRAFVGVECRASLGDLGEGIESNRLGDNLPEFDKDGFGITNVLEDPSGVNPLQVNSCSDVLRLLLGIVSSSDCDPIKFILSIDGIDVSDLDEGKEEISYCDRWGVLEREWERNEFDREGILIVGLDFVAD